MSDTATNAPSNDADGAPARTALAHPASVLAVLVLLANDQWWNAALPNWLTGKLGDVVGLFLFPLVVLAVLERVRPHRHVHNRARG